MPRLLSPPNLIDRVVGYFDPSRGLRRLAARTAMNSYNATKRSRFKRDRNIQGGSGDEHTDHWTLWELREIGRELDRNNGMSIGIIDRSIENIFGPEGPPLDPMTEDEHQNEDIEADFNSWLANDCDISGRMHGYQFLKKTKRGEYVAGDEGVQFDPVGRNGNSSLRPFEGDRIVNPTGVIAANGFPMVNGIAIDPDTGEEKFYFIANNNPLNGSVAEADGKAIPASSVVRFSNPRRLSQCRGVPIMTPVIQEFDDIDDLLLFERMGAKLVAAQGFIVETEDPYGMAEALRLQGGEDPRNERLEAFDPASVNYMKPGQTMKSVQSNRPSNNFDSFVNLLIRMVGLPLGMPIELVLLDFSKVNFSASRQLLHLAQLHFRAEQFETGCTLSKIYRLWMADRIRRGTYKLSPRIFDHAWGFPGWPSPNPTEDAKATALGIQTATDNRHDSCRRWGGSFKRNLKLLKKEMEMLIAAGLWTSTGSNPPAQGKANLPTDTPSDQTGGAT